MSADTRRCYPVVLAKLPLDIRLAAAREGARLYPHSAPELLAAALAPDPSFIGWVAEPPPHEEKLRQRLEQREWRRKKAA